MGVARGDVRWRCDKEGCQTSDCGAWPTSTQQPAVLASPTPQVDGPHHFTANTFRPLGDMYARRTLLEARGWRVVSVPFYHWSGDSDENRQATLQRLIADARRGEGVEVLSHPTHLAASSDAAAAAAGAAAAAVAAGRAGGAQQEPAAADAEQSQGPGGQQLMTEQHPGQQASPQAPAEPVAAAGRTDGRGGAPQQHGSEPAAPAVEATLLLPPGFTEVDGALPSPGSGPANTGGCGEAPP